MKRFELKEDVHIICSTVRKFPDTIRETFDQLKDTLPDCDKRDWYGISHPNEKGQIIYKAATTELSEGEASKAGYESFTIMKGTFITETISNWMQKTNTIGETFIKLLEYPAIDPKGYCLEWYLNDTDVLCMVRITD